MPNELDIVSRWMNTDGPTSVASIFSDLGINYIERPTEGGESGWIECKDGVFEVVVNSEESPQRRRFTAAHELGHYLMHRDLLGNGERLHRHTDRLFENAANNEASPFHEYHEVEANQLAAQILMPAKKVRRLFNGEGLTNLAELAVRFGVSQAAMEIRLKTLKDLE